MNAAPVWMRIAPYRACDLCCHLLAGATPQCGCPNAQQAGQPQPVSAARAPGGACGPDALLLDMETWR